MIEKKYFKIILIVFGVITYFGYKYFYILTIKKYNPVYVLFINPIIFFLEKIILMINTLIKKHSFSKEPQKITSQKIANFVIDVSDDIIAVIGFLIYLEV